MPGFKSKRDFSAFQYSIMNKSRYLHEDVVIDFLRAVEATCESRRTTLPSTELWRAQLGCEQGADPRGNIFASAENQPLFSMNVPFPASRMKPLPDSASEGRVNPKGIPCLYMSDDFRTAVAETRPWLNATVSVARMELKRPVSVVDCSRHADEGAYFDATNLYFKPDLSQEELSTLAWANIDWAFSEPVHPDEPKAHYAPTQVLAELFRHKGFDGVKYKSRLGEGHNIALFDLSLADVGERTLSAVSEITIRLWSDDD